MLICVITVYPEKKHILQDKFSFLTDNQKHELKICVFDKVKSYKGYSDFNSDVKDAIYQNTMACIAMADDLVLVLQEDVVFKSEKKTLIGLRDAVSFMESNKDADMCMLGASPYSWHSEVNKTIIKFTDVWHWHAVIFRKNILPRMPKIPRGTHSDVYFRKYLKHTIKCYGLKNPVAFQKKDRLIRFYEYGLLHKLRYQFPFGDPGNYIIIGTALYYLRRRFIAK